MANFINPADFLQKDRKMFPLDPLLSGQRHCDHCGCPLTVSNAAPVSEVATHRYCNACSDSFVLAADHDAQAEAIAQTTGKPVDYS